MALKSLLDKDFAYTPSKDHGPDYMQKKMEFYRDRVKEEAKEREQKVKPIIRGKVSGTR